MRLLFQFSWKHREIRKIVSVLLIIFFLEIKQFSTAWEFKVNGIVSGGVQSRLYFLVSFFKKKVKAYKQRKINREQQNIFKTKEYPLYSLLQILYILAVNFICAWQKSKFSREKDKSQFDSCVLELDFLSLCLQYRISRAPAWKNTEDMSCPQRMAAFTF